ncbi:hypothetical protein AAMO2058_000031900 [Amorphochlora amoebiformis]
MSRWGVQANSGGTSEAKSSNMDDIIAEARRKAQAIASKISLNLSNKPRVPPGGSSQYPVSSGAMHGEKRKKKIEIPVQDHPDINFLGLLIGPQGKTIKELSEKSGAKFMIRGRGSSKDGNDEDPDAPLYVLIISDTDEQMEVASRMINELLFDRDKLYAKKREQLSQMGSGQGGTLDMPASLYDEKVTADFDMRPPRHGPRGAGLGYNKSKDIRIPNDKVGLVIGRGGETIKSLQADTGARIQIAKDVQPGSPNRVVTLSGSEEQIDHAEREVSKLIESRTRQSEQRTYSQASKVIEIPQDKVGLLIGKGGETIRNLQQTTGCRIQVTRDSEADQNAHTRSVNLQGTDRQMAHAETEIENLMNQQPQPPPQQHPAPGYSSYNYPSYPSYPYPSYPPNYSGYSYYGGGGYRAPPGGTRGPQGDQRGPPGRSHDARSPHGHPGGPPGLRGHDAGMERRDERDGKGGEKHDRSDQNGQNGKEAEGKEGGGSVKNTEGYGGYPPQYQQYPQYGAYGYHQGYPGYNQYGYGYPYYQQQQQQQNYQHTAAPGQKRHPDGSPGEGSTENAGYPGAEGAADPRSKRQRV